jgi:ribosome maturation factor RimP
MSQKIEELEALLSPAVEALGLELLGIEYAPSSHRSVLRLYIDVEGRYIAVEDCEAVSREVSALLDVNDPIQGNYVLEVSSPGFDRPLFKPAHFQRFIGQQAKISLHLPQDGRRRFTATLRGVEGDRILIEQDGQEYSLAHDNIAKARLVPDYAALGAGAAATPEGASADPEASIYDDPEARPRRPGRGR